VPIDATGTIVGTQAGDVAFDGVGPLATYLAGSDDVKRCFVRFWSYFAYGRASWEQDACTYDAVRANAGQYGLRDTLMALIHAPHFTQRLQDVQ
jgi:hypothetical protein